MCDETGYAQAAAFEELQLKDGLGWLGERICDTRRLNGLDGTTPDRWEDKHEVPAVLCLLHSEVSESLEAFRKPDKPGFANEMADIGIRLVGLCHGMGIDLARPWSGRTRRTEIGACTTAAIGSEADGARQQGGWSHYLSTRERAATTDRADIKLFRHTIRLFRCIVRSCLLS